MHVDKPHIGARVSTKRRVIAGDAHADTGTVMRLEDGGYCVVKWDSDGESTLVLMMSLRPLSSDGYNEGFDDAARVARVLNSAASARVDPPAAAKCPLCGHESLFSDDGSTPCKKPVRTEAARHKSTAETHADDFTTCGCKCEFAPDEADQALAQEIVKQFYFYGPTVGGARLKTDIAAALAQARKEGAQKGVRNTWEEEGGDVLFVLLSILRHNKVPIADVLAALRNKIDELKTKPRYEGEEFAAATPTSTQT